MRYSELPQRANPYGVPYSAQPAVDGSPVGGAVEGLLSDFVGDSQNAGAKTRKPQFSPDQTYLSERINERFVHRLTWGGLHKLNQRFGVGPVTSAMRDACLADGVGSAYAYVYAVCRETA